MHITDLQKSVLIVCIDLRSYWKTTWFSFKQELLHLEYMQGTHWLCCVVNKAILNKIFLVLFLLLSLLFLKLIYKLSRPTCFFFLVLQLIYRNCFGKICFMHFHLVKITIYFDVDLFNSGLYFRINWSVLLCDTTAYQICLFVVLSPVFESPGENIGSLPGYFVFSQILFPFRIPS